MHTLIALQAIQLVVLAPILAVLVRIMLGQRPPPIRVKFEYLVEWPHLHIPITYGEITIMSEIIKIGGLGTTAKATFTDSAGVDVAVVGVPVWSATPDGLVTLQPAADGLSCDVLPVAAGDVTLTCVAEGDPTPGVDTVTLTGTLTVAADEATGGTITFTDNT
jgi:hypothetical protein